MSNLEHLFFDKGHDGEKEKLALVLDIEHDSVRAFPKDQDGETPQERMTMLKEYIESAEIALKSDALGEKHALIQAQKILAEENLKELEELPPFSLN